MAIGKLIVVSLSGGKFTTKDDGTMSYSGGDAHATSLTLDTKFDDFKSEIADMWEYDLNSITIKYFIPNNKRTLITISTDRDIRRFLEFHEDFAFADIYVIKPIPPVTNDDVPMPPNKSGYTIPDHCPTSPQYSPCSPSYAAPTGVFFDERLSRPLDELLSPSYIPNSKKNKRSD